MKAAVAVALLSVAAASCTAVGTVHNPACVVFCQNNGSDTITTSKENHNEVYRSVPSRSGE